MKVAIVHYWFLTWRGGEKVIQQLLEIFPDADVYTHVISQEIRDNELSKNKVFESFVAKLPWAKRHYQKYLPLMPLALEQFDLREYDLVISSESGPAKNVITGPDAIHICYCHSPMRYAWDMYTDYLNEIPRILKFAFRLIMHYMRIVDVSSSARVDYFIANSSFVSRRIQKFYRRTAEVVYPPVNLEDFEFRPVKDDYYLILGQLTGYKRADLAVRAFVESGRKLVVIGEGEQYKLIAEMRSDHIKVLGRRPLEEVRSYLSGAKALIFPGMEDLGLVPLEAMASGTPVIAYGKGGALETVVDSSDAAEATGIFFYEQTIAAINDAVSRFEAMPAPISASVCRRHAEKFSTVQFQAHIRRFVREKWDITFPHKRIDLDGLDA